MLGARGRSLLQCPNPSFIIGLPKQEATKKAAAKPTKASKQSKARKTVADDGEWLSSKPKAKKRKKAAASKNTKPAKKKTKAKAKTKTTTKKKASKAPTGTTSAAATVRPKAHPSEAEVIDLLSDGDDDVSSVDVPLTSLARNSSRSADEELWDDESSSEEENEFE